MLTIPSSSPLRALRLALALVVVGSLAFAGWRVSARKNNVSLMPPPLSGTKTVCPSGCDYASLTAAVADIQAQSLGGALVLELGATYVSTSETFPLTIPALNGASAVNTLTIRPASGATALSISSADTTAATVDLNGAQFVTIDGRPGGNYSTAMFVDAANGDLHLVPGGNVLVNAVGTPIAGVTDDYDGDPRSAPTPIIGADEIVLNTALTRRSSTG